MYKICAFYEHDWHIIYIMIVDFLESIESNLNKTWPFVTASAISAFTFKEYRYKSFKVVLKWP